MGQQNFAITVLKHTKFEKQNIESPILTATVNWAMISLKQSYQVGELGYSADFVA